MSYNKLSTFPAKHKYDNEEIPLKQPHKDAFTSKQNILERIKHLHIKCSFLDIEHVFMLTKTYLNINNMRMFMWKLRKISIMPTIHQTLFVLRNILIVGIPKYTVLVIIFRVFVWPFTLMNVGPRSIIHLQCFEMVSQKDEIVL